MKNLINDKNIDFCSNFKQSVLFSNILKNCFGPFFRKSSHCETWQPRPADVQTLFPFLQLFIKKLFAKRQACFHGEKVRKSKTPAKLWLDKIIDTIEKEITDSKIYPTDPGIF